METETETQHITTSKYLSSIAMINDGVLTPETVLEAAKPASSPIHGFFCWDDNEAAEQWRLHQASALIRRVKVTIEPNAGERVTVRAFVNIVPQAVENEEPASAVYVPIEKALEIDSYYAQLVSQCKRDIGAFRKKYAAIQECKAIIAAMDNFTISE